MTDHIISPDGKFMWTGSEWIPAPPTTTTETTSSASVSLQDSMVGGDIQISQSSSSPEGKVSLQDSAIGGDINITQNNAEDIAEAMMNTLQRLGFSGQTSPAELTPSQEAEVEQVLEISEQLTSHGIEIDPRTEITLGNAASLAGRTHTAQQHYLRALETFRKNGDRQGEAMSLGNLGIIAKTRGNLDEAERLHRESLAIMREVGDRVGEANSLSNLGNIAKTRGDLAEAERLHQESLAIRREIGNRDGEATSLINLGVIMNSKGQIDEERRMYTEAVRIRREIGIPIDQWFIDNGY